MERLDADDWTSGMNPIFDDFCVLDGFGQDSKTRGSTEKCGHDICWENPG
jgi:hypothetical protein